jgi:signal recognition particle subunit SRP54
MVLAELGTKITDALRKVKNAQTIDQTVIDEMLKDICNALLQADVQFKMVMNLRKNIVTQMNLDSLAPGMDPRRIAKKVCYCSFRIRLMVRLCSTKL